MAVTNTHVLSGQKTLSFVKPDGKAVEVMVDQLNVAMDRDLAFFPLKQQQAGLAVFTGKKKVDVGDEITCLGNTQGQSVITILTGRILAIGPDTIEHDASAMAGNSGCPILHSLSGEVIGVHTRHFIDSTDLASKGTRFEDVRWFCLKVDGARWRQVGWNVFADEANIISTYWSGLAVADTGRQTRI